MQQSTHVLIAVDIGNSRIKLARFHQTGQSTKLPTPVETIELPILDPNGEFESLPFVEWCKAFARDGAAWLISSVHRGATEHLTVAAKVLAKEFGRTWTVRQLTFVDVPLTVEVEAPERVGMDRLMGAVAADRLRPEDQAAVVVDLGTATKLCLLTDVGAFVGGAILPGLSMSARALEEQTDALPHVDVEHWQTPPLALGKSTVPAIEAGIFWGTVGAVRELVIQYSKGLERPPAVFVTGGGSALVAEVLADGGQIQLQHLPHLVLSGVAIVDATLNQR